jgi:membrane fusion protein, multidrug efflux system
MDSRNQRKRPVGLWDPDGREHMTKRKWLLGAGVVALAGIAFFTRGFWIADKSNAQAQAGAGGRVVTIEIGKAERKKMPVRLEALGSVTTIASVALKPRVDTTITGVHFQDGARVNKGDMLFTLDCRAMDAQIQTTEGTLARDQAQLAGAERDVSRYTDLVGKGATPVTNLDNAKTQTDVYRAAIKSDQGTLDNLKVQRSFCDVTAPISGRMSAAAVKVGNFVRQADVTPMATINQMAPVYVSFTIPQKNLGDIRQAIAAETGTVQAIVPGQAKRAQGQVSMIENSVDSTTGMAMVRATMPNTDELLWPGTLVTTEVTLRVEDAIVVPTNAVQVSQTGTFVFMVADGKAKVQPVTVDRQVGPETVISSGLNAGDTVVTDGQLLLSNGTRVNPRPAQPPGGAPKAAGS